MPLVLREILGEKEEEEVRVEAGVDGGSLCKKKAEFQTLKTCDPLVVTTPCDDIMHLAQVATTTI
jgi:hypothetical protein